MKGITLEEWHARLVKRKPTYSKYLANGYVEFECLVCGMSWHAKTCPVGDTGWTGFLEVNVRFHSERCKERTPAERRAYIEKTKKRIARRPNQHTKIYFNETHKGLKDRKGTHRSNDAAKSRIRR